MNTTMTDLEIAIDTALRGKDSSVTLYWDSTDPNNVGAAWKSVDDSGPLEFYSFARLDGKDDDYTGYNIADFFGGPDGVYSGPDQDGVFPQFDA